MLIRFRPGKAVIRTALSSQIALFHQGVKPGFEPAIDLFPLLHNAVTQIVLVTGSNKIAGSPTPLFSCGAPMSIMVFIGDQVFPPSVLLFMPTSIFAGRSLAVIKTDVIHRNQSSFISSHYSRNTVRSNIFIFRFTQGDANRLSALLILRNRVKHAILDLPIG